MNMRRKIATAFCTLAILALQMFPAFFIHDIRNTGNAHTESICQSHTTGSFRVQASNCDYSLICQKSERMFLTRRTTTFLDHVLRIVFCCSNPKMFWINAVSHITSMKNFFSERNFPSQQFPGQAVYVDLSWNIMAMVKLPVSVMGKDSGPQPASSRFFDSSPKQIFSCWSYSFSPTFSIAPFLWLPVEVVGEFFFAN